MSRGRGEPVMARDLGLQLVPFAFTINGTLNPLIANNAGDEIAGQQVTRLSAGVFTFALNLSQAKFIGCVMGGVYGASGDIVPQVTAADPVGNGANNITVKTLAGVAPTDPANGSIVSGVLICKTNQRRASLT